jgi:acetyl esterase/lipase
MSIKDELRSVLRQQIAPQFHAGVPLEAQRQLLEAMGSQSEMPAGVDIVRGELAGSTCEWLIGPGCSRDAALLHLHGGGYVMGSCSSHRAISARAGMACGIQAILPEYRLAPEHPFPAAVDDAVAAYRALLAQGIAPRRIALLGDSAGGGLVMATLLALREAKIELPGAVVLLSPWLDMTMSGDSLRTRAEADPWLSPEALEPFSRLYRGERNPAEPWLSPLFAELAGLPPILIQVGDQEILLSDSTRMAERARQAGVDVELEVWDELWHVWHLFAPTLPEANQALERIGTFVRSKLNLETGAAPQG